MFTTKVPAPRRGREQPERPPSSGDKEIENYDNRLKRCEKALQAIAESKLGSLAEDFLSISVSRGEDGSIDVSYDTNYVNSYSECHGKSTLERRIPPPPRVIECVGFIKGLLTANRKTEARGPIEGNEPFFDINELESAIVAGAKALHFKLKEPLVPEEKSR